MKRYLNIAILVASIFVALFLFRMIQKNKTPEPETISYSLQGKKLKLLVADTDQEHMQGLMYYRSLPNNIDGMIFLFPYKTMQTFWNKNTLMDLEVYWVNDEKVIGKSDLPSIEKSKELVYISSPEPVNKVIELVK